MGWTQVPGQTLTRRFSVAWLALFFLVPAGLFSQLPVYPPGTRAATAETPSPGPVQDAGPVIVQCPYPGDLRMWQEIVKGDRTFDLGPEVKGVILPHHLADPEEIAAAWRTLGRQSWDRVILLSPDHFLGGSTYLTLPKEVDFSTVWGSVPVDQTLVQKLAEAAPQERKRHNQVFVPEHGISVHTSFLRYFLPGTPFVPILVKQGAPKTQLDSLVRDLSKLSTGRTLVVASVDCSHYNPVGLSRFHDAMTAAALETMDGLRILKAEVDSPESLYVLNSLMLKAGCNEAQVFLRTDLQERFDHPIADNTSHLYVKYQTSAKPKTVGPTVTLLAFPAGAPNQQKPDPPVLPKGVLTSWTWNWNEPDKTARLFPALAELANGLEEDRRLWGTDLYLFDQGPERVVRSEISGVPVSVVYQTDRSQPDTKILLQERTWARQLVIVAESNTAAPWLGIHPDLLILRQPKARRFAVETIGSTTVVTLPGFLTQPEKDGTEFATAALMAVWKETGWDLKPWPISPSPKGPVYGLIPPAKSYDPPPLISDRE